MLVGGGEGVYCEVEDKLLSYVRISQGRGISLKESGRMVPMIF